MITVNTSGKTLKEAVEMTTDALNKQNDSDIQVFVDDTMSAFEIKKILEHAGLDVLIQDDDGRMTLFGTVKKSEPEQNDDNLEDSKYIEKIEKIENLENIEKINGIDKTEEIKDTDKIKDINEVKTIEDVKEVVQEKVAEKIKNDESNRLKKAENSEKFGNIEKSEKNTVFLIMSKTLGRDDNKLGGILIKGFLAGLVKTEPKPEAVILLNEGVKLALFDSSTCDHLKDLEARGTQILISGICTSHFGITDSIGAGVIANIYEIVDVINHAGKVVSL